MISAGGTGGGVFPALTVARALRDEAPGVSLSFVGARGDMARALVQQNSSLFDSYHEVLAGPLHGIPRLEQIANMFRTLIGVIQALILVIRLRPGALFLTGGWVGGPAAVACWLLRCPVVIYVPDIEPGLALRLLGRTFARTIAATVEDTGAYFPGKQVVVTGYPLRPEFQGADRESARRALSLDPDRPTLVFFGGSRGARSINTALTGIAPDLLADGAQIVHVTGRLDWPEMEAWHAGLPADQQAHYRIFPFLAEMWHALAAADLAISRAGASTLAEYSALGVPAILVPYPYAWRYQKINADYLVKRGAAVLLEDERLEADLLPLIRALLGDRGRLEAMRAAARSLRPPDGARALARLLLRTAGGGLDGELGS
jgi:UDP-N-acetylglucosamine--N-acetylmuramyl-(pentapeptide) pyrophosphoryl-undecaprenol N-acetylglucosamine transferase